MTLRHLAVPASAIAALVLLACSATPDPGLGQGGANGNGGQVSNGGSANGGSGNGGSNAAGGSGNGGSSAMGGSGNGGAGNGGSGNGGSNASGGSGNGGSSSGGANASGGSSSGGSSSAGGASSGGRTNSGGASSGGSASGGSASGGAGGASTATKFSFFVTSIGAMRELSGSQDGFGGNLKFGEATGLAGADKICKTIAEKSLAGAGSKTWRAFLSTVAGPVHAIDRVGAGPWYDRLGRVVALTRADLIHDRPMGADAAIINDLPNENGIPNHTDGKPGCTGNNCPDNHDVLTGTGPDGKLHSTITSTTCNDWTDASATAPAGGGGFMGNGPWCGHSWPRQGSGVNWMSALAEGGCGPGVNLAETGGPQQGVYTVGTGGGYGGIYCFALTP
ncbi:MAG: hypothetical protein QM756_04495 [Polyangiaceae bacterium]